MLSTNRDVSQHFPQKLMTRDPLAHPRARVHVFDSVFFVQEKLLLLQRAVKKKKTWLTLSAFCRSLVFCGSFQDDITMYEIRNNTAHFWSSGGRSRWFYGITYTEIWWFASHLLSNQVYIFKCQCIVNMSRLWSEKLSPWQPFAMVTTMNMPDNSAICTLCLCLEEGTW